MNIALINFFIVFKISTYEDEKEKKKISYIYFLFSKNKQTYKKQHIKGLLFYCHLGLKNNVYCVDFEVFITALQI